MESLSPNESQPVSPGDFQPLSEAHPLDGAIQALQKRLGEKASPTGTPAIPEADIQSLREKALDGTEIAAETENIDGPPGIVAKMVGRLFGTDLDDKLPWTRLGTTVAGSVGGAYIGAQVPGPAIAKGIGATAGSVAGTVIGAVAPETTLQLLESAGILAPGERDRLGLSNEQLMTVVEGEALLDLATLGGVSAIRMIGRGTTTLMTGANRTSRGLAEVASREGIALLPVQVGEGRFARGFVSVMGRFPWVANGLKKKSERALGQIQTAFDGIPQRLGPITTFDQVSQNILREATATARQIGTHFDTEFAALYARADMQGIKIRPVRTRAVTDALLTAIERETPQGIDNVPLAVPKGTNDLRSFIQRTTNLLSEGVNIADQSMRRMDTVMKTIDEKMVAYARTGDTVTMGRLDRLRQAVQWDMLQNAVGRGAGGAPGTNALAGEIQALDTGLTEIMATVFQSTTARRLGATLSPTIRAARFTDLGQRGMDQLAQVVMRGRGADVIQELQHLVQPETMRQLGNAVFNDALTKSMSDVGEAARYFDADKFAEQLGLNATRSPEYARTAALVNAAGGLTMDELGSFVEIARRANRAEIPDTSAFIARQATLSGIQSVVKNALPWTVIGGASAAGGWQVGLMTILGTRGIASMLSNPANARAWRMVANQDARIAVRRAAYVRLYGGIIGQMTHEGTITPDQANNLTGAMGQFTAEFDKRMDAQ